MGIFKSTPKPPTPTPYHADRGTKRAANKQVAQDRRNATGAKAAVKSANGGKATRAARAEAKYAKVALGQSKANRRNITKDDSHVRNPALRAVNDRRNLERGR